jgi:hypothetical protein
VHRADRDAELTYLPLYISKPVLVAQETIERRWQGEFYGNTANLFKLLAAVPDRSPADTDRMGGCGNVLSCLRSTSSAEYSIKIFMSMKYKTTTDSTRIMTFVSWRADVATLTLGCNDKKKP